MLELMCLEEAKAEADKIITRAMSEQKTIQNVLPGTPSDPQESSATTHYQAQAAKPINLKSRFSNQIKRTLTKQGSDLFFKDGQRQIDMVIAFNDTDDEDFILYRKIFQQNLIREGFEIEFVDKSKSTGGDLHFLKLHAPWAILCKYAEAISLKMPLKVNQEQEANKIGFISKMKIPFDRFYAKLNNSFKVRSVSVNTRTSFLTAPFVLSRIDNFAIESTDTFFIPSQRSMLVWHALCRAPFSKEKQMVGINKLIQKGVYSAAFPLHDGDASYQQIDQSPSTRGVLYREWGSWSSWYRPQPLGLVRDYFGDKIGMYFAWLGFYTLALVPPAIVGVLCFLYGAMTLVSEQNVLTREICNMSSAGNFTMCPLCTEACPYWTLGDSCKYSVVSYLFDNYATCFFAVFMSLWATIYLEMWSRRQSRLAWEWDLMETEFGENEEVRVEYEMIATHYRISPITKQREPYLPIWQRAGRFALSGSGVIFLCVVLLVAMILLIIYRITMVTVFAKLEQGMMRQNAKLISSISASCINLIAITIFKLVGMRFIYHLTVFETHRTETEFESSYIFKVFIFDFINVYSSFLYIAIFKGRFYIHPGDDASRTPALKTVRADVCDPSGCFFELCIQLIIVMIGRQMMNHFIEIGWPVLQNWWRRFGRWRNRNTVTRTDQGGIKPMNRWEKDYMLEPIDPLALYEEYHEVVIQYGLVTLFVAAFPLAPFFAIINNLIELRVDAFNIVNQYRRPVARRVANTKTIIDELMKFVTYAAVISNAFVIAYSSEFIPRLVFYYLNNFDMDGYIKFTLSEFNTSDYGQGMAPRSDVDDRNITQCYYRAMRNPPDDPTAPYALNLNYWYTTVCRLIFVVVFEHLVFFVTGLVAYFIPDVPSSVRENLIRERLLEREALVSKDADSIIASHKKNNVINHLRPYPEPLAAESTDEFFKALHLEQKLSLSFPPLQNPHSS